MNKLIPLTLNPTYASVLLVDTSPGFAALVDCAEHRLTAAYGLVDSLTCMTTKDAASQDLLNVAEVVQILLADATDLYKAARTVGLHGEVPHG
ncbi:MULTISPECIES: hypothetical protein [unclassified Pseudomonas]|uniref:hypothetical protein n=1 Tax=unclassified Pseudomonas TaxID=196821 RepID=UPI00131E48BD|nr:MULTISPECIES: hypothetical protein [unclassified Pseudomonas]